MGVQSSPLGDDDGNEQDFVSDWSAVRTVCGRDYTCVETPAGGRVWEMDSASPASYGCRVDPLVSLAHARGCEESVSRLRAGASVDRCTKKAMPCLEESATGLIHCINWATPANGDGVRETIDGSLKCVDPPTYDTHQELNQVKYAAYSTKILEERPVVAPEPARRGGALEEPSDPTQELRVFLHAQSKLHVSSDSLTREDEGSMRDVVAEAPVVQAPVVAAEAPVADATRHAGEAIREAPRPWMTCDWFYEPTKRACNVDAHCASKNDVLDVWVDSMFELFPDSVSVKSIVDGARRKATRAHFELEQQLDEHELPTRVDLRSELSKLYDADDTFRKSVSEMVSKEPFLKDALSLAKKGSCAPGGVCAPTAKTKPTHHLYTQESSVGFGKLEDDEARFYIQRDGAPGQPVHLESCDGPDRPDKCTDGSVEVVEGPSKWPRLDPSKHKVVKSEYRIELDGGTYLFRNRVAVNAADEQDAAAKAQCAQRLCDRNANACPAPYCRVDESSACVPNEEKVESVRLTRSV